MKAEQRKELETNTLADKMGRVVQRVKASPRRTFVTYALVAAAVVVAAYLGYNWWNQDVSLRSLQWLHLYDGGQRQLVVLTKDETSKDSNAAKAARFQLTWYLYWDEGIKLIGEKPAGALGNIQIARQEYDKLITVCKDDPLFEPQAMLGRAVCTESLAAQDLANLDRAKDHYKELADHDKYKDLAEGKFAKDRLDLINHKEHGPELRQAYKDLNRVLEIPAAEDRRQKLDNFKGFPQFQAPK